jgi:general secretion pathway protein K
MAYASRRAAQSGAAILMAMLVVVLVATLASSMMWQQWRAVEVESAQRTRVQSKWILTGALDWARLILREDARQGGTDHLSEPWAVPLAPAQLSTFLATERGQALVTDDNEATQETFLSGGMQDLQGRLNLTNLLFEGKLHEPSIAAWSRLFKFLKLPQAELDLMAQGLLRAATGPVAAEPNAEIPLMPQSVGDLAWLGLSAVTVKAISPFVTVLPERTPVNLNTASPEVLLAAVPGLGIAQARQLVQTRSLRPFTALTDADLTRVRPDVRFEPAEHAVASRFFGVVGQLRLGQHAVQERSVLQRDGMDVKVLRRTREVLTTPDLPLQ